MNDVYEIEKILLAALADDEGDIMQKKESIHHIVEHQQHQEGKSLEECNISPTTSNTATSESSTLMKRKSPLIKKVSRRWTMVT